MKFDDSTISKNKSVATEFFRAYQVVKSEKPSSTTNEKIEYPGGTTGFIPFNIEFTVDGISGIKIYDKLEVDTSFLPLGYTKTLEFIVTGVNHSLKDGDWETKIKTTLIPKFDETNETVTAADANLVTYTPKIITSPIIKINNQKPNQYGGLRGDLFAWVPGPYYPDPSDPNNYNGTNYPYPKYQTFTEEKRQKLIAFQTNQYIVQILKTSNDSKIKSRKENWIQKPTTNPPTVEKYKEGGAVVYNTISFTQQEQTKMYTDILSKIGAQPTVYNLLWMKIWRIAEGAAATYNPWNSIQGKPNSTKFNAKPGVQNYWTYSDGLAATVATLTNGNYPTILKALIKGLNSYDEMKELASLTQLWDMTGKIPSKWQ